MKRSSFIRLFTLLLAILMIIPMLAACGGEEGTTVPSTNNNNNPNGNNNNNNNNNNDNGETPEIPIISDKEKFLEDHVYLAERGITEYSVVHAEDAYVLTKSEALILTQEMLEWTETEVPLVENTKTPLTKKEIIVGVVGKMGRPELEEFAASYELGLDDYVIKYVDGDVIIAAGSKEASVFAMTYLKKRILMIDEKNLSVAIPKDLHYVMRADMKYGTGGLKRVEVNAMSETEFLFTVNPHSEKDVLCRVTYSGNGGWRVQTKYNMSEEFNDIGAAQLLAYVSGEKPYAPAEKLIYWEQEGRVIAQAPDGTFVVLNTDKFALQFCKADSTLVRTLTKINHAITGKTETLQLLANFDLDGTEAIYGSGERFGSVNQRGKRIVIQSGSVDNDVTNPYVAVPLLSSSRGSGLFINNNGYMTADIGVTKKNELSFELSSGNIDFYVFVTDSITDVLDNYGKISGYAQTPQNWTYGLLVCRYDKAVNNLEAVQEMIAKADAYDIAWTGILIDGWDVSAFGHHKQLKEVCDLVHSLGKKVICNMNVGLIPSGGLSEEFALTAEEEKEFILSWKFRYYFSEGTLASWTTSTLQTTTTNNIPLIPVAGDLVDYPIFVTKPTSDDTKNDPYLNNPFNTKVDGGERSDPSDDITYETRTFLDITNPAVVNWFFGEYWDYLVNEIGLDGAKVDGSGVLPDALGTLNFYDETFPSGGARAWYPAYFTKLLNDVLTAKPDSGVCFVRGGGIGAQRNGYIWGGEQSRTINRLERQIKGILSAGLSGMPFVTYDIGGSFYKHGAEMSIEDEATIVLRSVQFATFTAAMQTTDTDVRGIFDFEEEDPDYAFVTDVYSTYTRIHEALQPYLNEYAQVAVTEGMPLVRHLVLAYQNDVNVYNIENQFMFGDAFLVAPELYGEDSREVYLPEGKWKNLLTGEELTVGAEGMTVTCNVTLAEIPVFYNMNTTSKTAASVLPTVEGLIADAQAIVIPR